jgi:hypothetical protein
MTVKLGFTGVVSRNTASWATPTWSAIGIVQEANTSMDRDEAEGKQRGKDATEYGVGCSNNSVELTVVNDPADANYEALRDAYTGRTTVELAIMSEAIATTGSEGLRAVLHVTAMGRVEPIDGIMTVTFTLKPALGAANDPTWYEV